MNNRLDNKAEGSARPEGGREAPALGGGSGAALCGAPGGEIEAWWRSGPVVGGVVASLVVVFLFVLAALRDACVEQPSGAIQCESRWQLLSTAPFNEIGDTLAGFAGALAFVWLIVTVLIQGRELAAQRAELRLTRIEFGEQRLASQEMARAMSAQAKLLEGEAQQRAFNFVREELERLISQLHKLAVKRFSIGITYFTEDEGCCAVNLTDMLPRNILKGSDIKDFTTAELLGAIEKGVSYASTKAPWVNDQNIEQILDVGFSIQQLIGQASSSVQMEIYGMEIERAIHRLQKATESSQ